MTLTRFLLRLLVVVGLLLSLAAAPATAASGTLLQAYAGSWSGQGVLNGGAAPERFTCHLSVTKGSRGKIHFSGSCGLKAGTLSVRGTIAYIEAKRHYEATLSSIAGFSGVAVGSKRGDGLVFSIRDRRAQNKNKLSAEIELRSKTITISFRSVIDGKAWNGKAALRR